MKARTDWESTLRDWQADHAKLTAQLIDAETEINNRVYALYHLTPADIQLLETHMQSTNTFYPLGEV